MEVELKGVSNFILNDVNLKIANGEFFALLGPNGAGKTTLLNVISGLTSYEGNVLYDGVAVDDVPVEERGISYLFQELYLFPNMTVYENIAFGLRNKRVTRKEKIPDVDGRVWDVLRLLKIENLRNRYPVHLSGGEKQRVALARALAVRPSILLLDEPFKSIDEATSRYLREEVRDIQEKLELTTIYVVHEISQLEGMPVRVAVLIDGKIRLIGSVQDVYFDSQDEAVLDFVGKPNILRVNSREESDSGFIEAVWGKGVILIPKYKCENNSKITKLAISPWDVRILPLHPESVKGLRVNVFSGRILRVELESAVFRITVGIGSEVVIANLPRVVFERMRLNEGNEVVITFDMEKVRVYQ